MFAKRFSFLFVLFIFGCSVDQNNKGTLRNKSSGHWDIKAQTQDKKSGKTNSLRIDLQARNTSSFRAEITGTLGIPVASLVLNNGKFMLAVHTQKKFFVGTSSEKNIQSISGLAIDPGVLLATLLDNPLSGDKYECQLDSLSFPTLCQAKNVPFNVEWRDRSGELKRILFHQPESEVQLVVKSYSTKVQTEDSFFQLIPPPSYRILQIDSEPTGQK